MSIFIDADLQGFSDLAVSLAFKDSCDVKRRTRVVDDQGGADNQTTWTTVNTVPCLVTDITTKTYDITLAQRTDELVIKHIFLPRLTDVRIDDKLVINAVTFDIIGIEDIVTYEVVRKVYASREV